MKTYKIVLLTGAGLKTETYTDDKPLEKFENEMTEKHGTFVMQSSNEI